MGLWTLHPAALQRLCYTEMPGNCRTRGERVDMEECKGRSWRQKEKDNPTWGSRVPQDSEDGRGFLEVNQREWDHVKQGTKARFQSLAGVSGAAETEQCRVRSVCLSCCCPVLRGCTHQDQRSCSLSVAENHDFYKQNMSEQFLQKGTKWAVCSPLL